MSYKEKSGVELDLSASGRGLQQTLLVLSYLYSHQQTILLIDEPDAHLEILRQRQIYKLLTDTAEAYGSQVIAASHSEVVLNEAAARDTVVAFVGKPHRIDNTKKEVLKALKDIGFEDYYQAELTGWILYLEGSTDLDILRSFAEVLSHPATDILKQPFVHYTVNDFKKMSSHFHGLQEAKPNLVGVGVFDRVEVSPSIDPSITALFWRQREIENYLCNKDVLYAYTRFGLNPEEDLVDKAELLKRVEAMTEAIDSVSAAARTYGKPEPWGPDIKASDDFLDPLFNAYFSKLGLPTYMRKNRYYKLVQYIKPENVDSEVIEKLDALLKMANSAETDV
jgi:hypothetical protein